MKKLYVLLPFLFITTVLSSQPWLNNLPQNKSKQELSLFDYQKAFYDYWAPFKVDKGYYFAEGIKVKAAGWKQFKRWEYDLERQVNPTTGKFPGKTPQQVYDEYLDSHTIHSPANSANWTCLGTNSTTGGYAGIGRINCIAFHPSDNNTYWIGSASGGLWVTTNNGSTWTCLTDNTSILGISDIVIPQDYATSNTIYIATGDKDHWDNRSVGVIKSTNGGSTWSTTGLSFSLSGSNMVNRILIDPNNSQILIAATTNGVYKTTNGGTTWNTQLTTQNFIDMEYKPGDFNTIWGSTNGGLIMETQNGGTTWGQIYWAMATYRVELAVTPNLPGKVLSVSADHLSGLYEINGSYGYFSGSTLNLLGWNSNGLDPGGQGWYDLSLAVSPTDAHIILVGGINTWRSTDGGSSWSIVNHWWGDGVPAVHADKHKLIFRSNGDLFECNDGGVYLSTDNGTTWTDKTNGIVISQMYKLGVSATNSYEVITGLQDNGTKLLSGGTWTDVKDGDGMECMIDYSDVNIQYGSYIMGQIDRTTNHWASATNIQPGSAGDGAWVTPYIIDPVNPQIIYAGYADVWKTTDRGNNWTQKSYLNTSQKIRSMAIAPSNTQYLYVADYSHIWKTSNGGMTWTDITGTIPSGAGTITSIAVKNDDPNTLWVTLGGYTANTIYQSLNGGNTWADISGGLPQLPVYTIVQNKQSTTEVHLYVGTELGVYFKKGTNDWIPFNTDLPNVKLGELEIYYSANPQNSLIRAATYGRGLWETPVYYVCTPTPSPTISGPSIVCTGAQVVNYTTETGMTGYSWSVTSEGTITGGAGTNQVTVSWNSPGAGSVFVNYTNSSGCSAENPSNYTVTVSQAPAADFSFPANNCEMQNVQFTDLSSQNGGDTLTSWNWDFGDPGSGSGNMSTLQNPLHLYTLAANYTVEEIVTNLHGCTDTIFHQINIHPLPPAIITPNGPTTFCEGDSVVLSASSASSYIWSDGEISQSITVSISGTYSVTVTNGFGCMATSVPTTVTMLPLAGIPEIPAGPDTVDVHTIFSSSYFTYSAPGAVTYSWQVNPSDAGTIGGSDTTGNMVWSTSFMGNARISVMSVNSCGVSSWSGEMLTVVLNTTGTGNKSPFTILIYPNPATTQLTVEFPEFSSNPAAFLDLYEIQGQWIKKVTITEKKTQVDISTLPVGIYLIRLTLGNDSRMIKVVKTE